MPESTLHCCSFLPCGQFSAPASHLVSHVTAVLMCTWAHSSSAYLGVYLLQALLVSLRLWGRLPKSILKQCSLLPHVKHAPPPDYLTSHGTARHKHTTTAATAFFAPEHLRSLVEGLRSSTSAHPAMHSVWPTLLALLLPDFSLDQVIFCAASVYRKLMDHSVHWLEV